MIFPFYFELTVDMGDGNTGFLKSQTRILILACSFFDAFLLLM